MLSFTQIIILFILDGVADSFHKELSFQYLSPWTQIRSGSFIDNCLINSNL